MKWTLDNEEQRHAEHPDTFELPEEQLRKSLRPGMFAKLVFLTDDMGGERMWVQVKDVLPDGYIGSLDNNPVVIEDLEYGDLVSFRPEHVIDVHIAD